MIQQILQFYGKRYFKALFPKGKGKVEFVIFKLPQKEMRQIFLGLILRRAIIRQKTVTKALFLGCNLAEFEGILGVFYQGAVY